MSPSLAFQIGQPLLTILSLWALFRWICPQGSFPHSCRDLGKDALFTPKGRRGFFAILLFLVAGSVQNSIDPWFTELAIAIHGVEDFSVYIYRLEGSATSTLQSFAPKPIIGFFLYVYVCLFPAVFALLLLVFHNEKNDRCLRASIRALVLNYVLALPFFLFFSVRETWYADLGPNVLKARSLLSDLSPELEPLFRTARGVENNFPSLHTSIAVTAFLIARQSDNRRLKILTGISALLVMFSTLYLGFHWVTDMVAGVLLAWVSVRMAFMPSQSSKTEENSESTAESNR
ncbi:MAG: phosphatase PAP2 family protein [Planctomycetota bacterium]|nr:phosphatase PAP2 family protein [Planctomycetota bacterium]